MPPTFPLLTVEVRFEQDLVLARQRARQIANLLGFDAQEQTRIATAVSEVVRNGVKVAGSSRVEFSVGGSPQAFQAAIILAVQRDNYSPSNRNTNENSDGNRSGNSSRSSNGNSNGNRGDSSDEKNAGNSLSEAQFTEAQSSEAHSEGIMAAQRLVDEVQIKTHRGRSIVVLLKQLPRQLPSVTRAQLIQIGDELARQSSQDPYIEIQQQNQELLRTLEALQQRQEELAQLNQELEDTNRGVLALYAELNEKAESLQKASELKTRFLSNISHEFRTPLYAVLSLSKMLLSHMDGDLTEEQEKQVTLIRKSAESLADLVNDLLDLAKVESGKVDLRIVTVEVQEVFSALRGMMRPLLGHNSAVSLVFEDAAPLPKLQTDEGKLSQILRNLISNALKYTEQGEVRVTARLARSEMVVAGMPDDFSRREFLQAFPQEATRLCQQHEAIVFTVADTGIGIDPADQQRIFEEFVQVENPLQQRVKGTGLGLPLCKRLAELLGGRIDLDSAPGQGSRFSVTLPLLLAQPLAEAGATLAPNSGTAADAGAAGFSLPRILLIDDDEVFRYTMRRYLGQSCQLMEAADGQTGLSLAQTAQPQVILLDLIMPEVTGFDVLRSLQQNSVTRSIPVIIMTSKLLTQPEQQELQSAAAILAKLDGSRIDRLSAGKANRSGSVQPSPPGSDRSSEPLQGVSSELKTVLQQLGLDLNPLS
ncbi:ATP-binding protein [Leptolyngbya ohadii]|uniref:ATP-binding protein n=1 Tax=Leptolyngbya ohadii TaxID=1962290 RepID=UPI000B59C3C0|nr:ATP-binding protein [Leptolyngbya ohadii]